MKKEKYEKPKIEVIDLLNEIFTAESPDPEESGGDIFDDAANTLLQMIMPEDLEGFTEEDPDKENEESEDEGVEKDSEEAGISGSDPSVLDDLLNELDNAASDIQDQMSGGGGSGGNVESSDSDHNVSEDPVEQVPVQETVPEDTFSDPSPEGQPTSGEQEGF